MAFRNIKTDGKAGEKGKRINLRFPWEMISHFGESLLRAHCVSATVLTLGSVVYLLPSCS